MNDYEWILIKFIFWRHCAWFFTVFVFQRETVTIMIKLQLVCVSCCLRISYTTQHNTRWHNTTQHNTTFKIIFSVVGGLFCISKSKNDANYTIWRVGQAPDWWNLTECGLCQFLWGAWLCVYVERAELVFTQGEQRGARGASLQTDTLTC